LTTIRFKRGTRSKLNQLALKGELLEGEPLYITDDKVLAMATSKNTLSDVNQVSPEETTATLLTKLNSAITESQLYSALGDRINLIDQPTTGLVTKVSDLQTVYGSTVNAATSAAAASQSAADAANAEAAAILAKSAAELASNTSATSATNASNSATTATTKAADASTSANAAATSATTATAKASEASTSATSASNSATTATTKAADASTSASQAATSATNSAGSAASASSSATTAATSATNAGAAASAASTSATNAATSATNAGTSATSASNSATTATTKAADAGVFASNAATSATNAAGSASASASSFTQVQSVIRGTSLGLPLEQWNLNGQSLVIISDGKVGNIALRLAGNFGYANQGNFIPINPGKKYRVRFWARPSSNAAGLLYFSLQQFIDANNTGPVNGGRSPYKPSGYSRANHITAYGDTWGEYNYVWSDADWQAGVKYFRPEFLDNYSGQVGYWDIQGFTIYDISDIDNVSSAVQTLATTTAGPDGSTAQYTVKVDSNGYVAGFGLSSTSNSSTPSSGFIVRADKFAIASPAGPGVTPSEPFIVYTTPTAVNGITVQPGVYIKSANIETITADKIVANSITTEKLVVGSASALNYSNTIFNSGNIPGLQWIFGTPKSSGSGRVASSTVTTSGGSITFKGVVNIDIPVNLPTSVNIVAYEVFPTIDDYSSYPANNGKPQGVGRSFLVTQPRLPRGNGAYSGNQIEIPFLSTAYTPAGDHVFAIDITIRFYDSLGNVTNVSLSFSPQTFSTFLVFENKV
jgi:hypothetical protein